MRTFLLTLFIFQLLSQSCKGQTKAPAQEILNKEFNWKIKIPEGFDTVSAAQWMKMQNRGTDAIEKTYGAEVENNASTLFVFKSDQFNYFESNHQPFDTSTEGDYFERFKSVNNILYGTFESQMPNAKLDSASSEEVIDGKKFQTFRVTITIPDKIAMEYLMYSRLFGNKEFTVNILTVNKEKQQVLLRAWRNSKFGTE